MNTLSAQERVARQLIAAVKVGAGARHEALDEAIKVCDMLRVPLAGLTGAAGFASLLARALALGKRRSPALEGFHVTVDGTLSQRDASTPYPAGAPGSSPPGVVLIAELLGLLVTFIGETLTLRLLRGSWPNLAFLPMPLRSEDSL